MAREFNVGDVVTVRQRGTMTIGGVTLSDNTYGGVTIVGRNADGSYQIDLRRAINAPGMESVRVPAEWID